MQPEAPTADHGTSFPSETSAASIIESSTEAPTSLVAEATQDIPRRTSEASSGTKSPAATAALTPSPASRILSEEDIVRSALSHFIEASEPEVLRIDYALGSAMKESDAHCHIVNESIATMQDVDAALAAGIDPWSAIVFLKYRSGAGQGRWAAEVEVIVDADTGRVVCWPLARDVGARTSAIMTSTLPANIERIQPGALAERESLSDEPQPSKPCQYESYLGSLHAPATDLPSNPSRLTPETARTMAPAVQDFLRTYPLLVGNEWLYDETLEANTRRMGSSTTRHRVDDVRSLGDELVFVAMSVHRTPRPGVGGLLPESGMAASQTCSYRLIWNDELHELGEWPHDGSMIRTLIELASDRGEPAAPNAAEPNRPLPLIRLEALRGGPPLPQPAYPDVNQDIKVVTWINESEPRTCHRWFRGVGGPSGEEVTFCPQVGLVQRTEIDAMEMGYFGTTDAVLTDYQLASTLPSRDATE